MHERGYNDALTLLGMEKTAVVSGALRTAGGWAKNLLPTKAGVKQFFVGSPKKFFEEVRAGKAFSPEGMLAESFRAPGTFNKAMFYGLPAYDMARTVLDDQGNKAERLGEQFGGNLLGIAAFRPFGMLGSLGAGFLGGSVGKLVGRGAGGLIDQARGKTSQEPSENLNPYVY